MTDRKNHEPAERRPIASRSSSWAQAIAHRLAAWGVSPNLISIASVGFAALAAAALLAAGVWDGMAARVLWLAAAVGVQLRLLANLFDGMVAIETGKASPVGELFNEVPDRVSDVFIFVALGFVPGSSPHWGYLAAILAVFVAYIRAVGGSAGVGQVFAGVMAKQRRMFLVTVLCLILAVIPAPWRSADIILDTGIAGVVLGLVSAGCLLTIITRLAAITRRLRDS